MRLLAWNIRQGGGVRRERIVEEIAAYDADVIALTEFRTAPGVALRAALRERGWPVMETTNPAGSRNGIAVFSRTAVRRIEPCPAPNGCHDRWLDLDLPEYGFSVGVLHIMAAGSNRKDPTNVMKGRFWRALLRAAEGRIEAPFLLVGDWNTGAHRMDEAGKTYVCAGEFARLSEMGWTDLWRRANPGPTEWTWYSVLKGGVRGNGFRLDHAFATASLCPRIRSCRYSHVERDAGISDHSITIVEVE